MGALWLLIPDEALILVIAAIGLGLILRLISGRAAAAAKERFGLLTAPQVRETIRLTKGVPVRHVRATVAGRGVWELTSSQRLPPKAIKKVTPLKKLTR